MNIIEEMYNEDFFSIETYSHSIEEYRKAIEDLVAAESEFLNSFPPIRETL